MTITELTTKIRLIRELQSLIDEAEAERQALQDEIKAFMGDAEELHAGEYKITWRPVTSSRLDTKALQQAVPELAAKFTRAVTVRRFCVH